MFLVKPREKANIVSVYGHGQLQLQDFLLDSILLF